MEFPTRVSHGVLYSRKKNNIDMSMTSMTHSDGVKERTLWKINVADTALGTVALTGLVGAGVGVGYYVVNADKVTDKLKKLKWISTAVRVLSLLVGARRRFGTIDIHRSLKLCDKLMILLWGKIQESTILVIRRHLLKDDILFRQVPFDETSDCFLTKFNFEATGWWFTVIWYRCVVTVVVVAKVSTARRSLFTYFTTRPFCRLSPTRQE